MTTGSSSGQPLASAAGGSASYPRNYRPSRHLSDKKGMRIAFLTLQWPGVRMSGIGAAVRQIALALAAAGHDVHVFTVALPEDADRPTALTIHECDDLAALINRNQLPAASAASIQAGGDGVYRLSLAWRLCQA